MIDKIDNIQALSNASSMFKNSKRALSNSAVDISINNDYSSLVEMAKESSQTDSEIIAKAREAIKTGELESMANIQNAAQNIFTFGI